MKVRFGRSGDRLPKSCVYTAGLLFAMRKALLYTHLWAGLTASLFLVVLGVTGALVAFENEIDRALNAKLSYVLAKGQPLSLAAIEQSLQSRYSQSRVEGFELPERPDLSLFVALVDNSGKHHELFVDPYSGMVLGSAEEANHFTQRIHQFHTHLVAGEIGRQIVGWSGVFLLLLSISGIILWWPSGLFRLRWTGSGKRFNFELHNTIGILSSLFLFVFAATSVCIHWEKQVEKLAEQMSPAQASRAAMPHIPAPGIQPLSPDRLVEIARNTLPGARVVVLQLPASPKVPVQVALKFPEDHTPVGRSRLRMDAYTGSVLLVESSRRMPAPIKYARMWNRELHTGDILYLPTRIVAAFFSLMLPVLAITGPLIWWNRRTVTRAPVSRYDSKTWQ
jgi:uncharacterized iron-regulated membrane protein